MKNQSLNGARSLRVVPKQSANDPLHEADEQRPPKQKGDNWRILFMWAGLPLGLVSFGLVIVKAGSALGWWA